MWDKLPSLFAEKVGDEADKMFRTFAVNVYNNVIALSPVDTGRYRNAHHISIGSPSLAENGGGIGLVLSLPKHTYPIVYLQNNLPYASVIEFGGYPNPVKRGTRVKGKKIAGKQAYEIRSVNGFSYQAPQGVYSVAFTSALASL